MLSGNSFDVLLSRNTALTWYYSNMQRTVLLSGNIVLMIYYPETQSQSGSVHENPYLKLLFWSGLVTQNTPSSNVVLTLFTVERGELLPPLARPHPPDPSRESGHAAPSQPDEDGETAASSAPCAGVPSAEQPLPPH